MTSDSDAADHGLLSPYWAGTAVASETGDAAVLRAILDVEVASAAAQARLGLVPDAAAEAIRTAAAGLTLDAADLAGRARRGGNPIIPLLADLRAAVGPDAAGFVHLGATSQDILDTALMLVAQRSIARFLPISAPRCWDSPRSPTGTGALPWPGERSPSTAFRPRSD